MIKGKLTALIALMVILFAASCSKEGPNGATGLTGPVGPAGPADTGGISGHLQLYDQYGSRVLIGLYGTQMALSTGVVTYTDSNGYYRFTPVTTGAYTLYVHDTATSTVYADTRISDFQFISDTLNRDVKMSAIPSFSPTSITVIDTPGSVLCNRELHCRYPLKELYHIPQFIDCYKHKLPDSLYQKYCCKCH